MYRGQTTFHCDNCGHRFIGPDIEWNATILSAPARCPECGSWHTYTSIFYKDIYKKIWKDQDR